MTSFSLNLKHLRYFWTVAREGSVTQAAEVLSLTPQTISGQLKELESQVGFRLFRRQGRTLALTGQGQQVYHYADAMFRIGLELQDVLLSDFSNADRLLRVGVAMVVPKLLAFRVLEPVVTLPEPGRLICHEAPLSNLLNDLISHKLDLVLADCPASPVVTPRVRSQLLGESGLSFFAARTQAELLSAPFPACLDQAPLLMPTSQCALQRVLLDWFDANQIRPAVVAEFEDRALMKTFGERGVGIFSAPVAVEQDVLDKYDVTVLGRTHDIKERYYAISAERHVQHPAVEIIREHAQTHLFS